MLKTILSSFSKDVFVISKWSIFKHTDMNRCGHQLQKELLSFYVWLVVDFDQQTEDTERHRVQKK